MAFVTSTLGCLLAIMLAIKARGHTRRGRGRLLVYATLALGGTGIFQADFLAILGFGPRDASVRYDLLAMLESFGVAIVVVGIGLFLISFRHPGTVRLMTAGILFGLGVAAAHYVAVNGIRGTYVLYYEPMRFVGSVAIAMLAGSATLWFIVTLRGLRAATLAASIAGAGLCGMHYAAMSAVQIEPSILIAVAGSGPTAGLSPMVLMGPTVLLGAAVTAMLWFFTVGTSTMDDLNAIFENPDHSMEIEPWMIEEVTTRIALANGFGRSGCAANGPTVSGFGTSGTGTNGFGTSGTGTNGIPAQGAKAGPARASRPVPAPEWTAIALMWGEQRPPAVQSPAPNAGPANWPTPPDRYPPTYTATLATTAPPDPKAAVGRQLSRRHPWP